jgi:hypothetical protein
VVAGGGAVATYAGTARILDAVDDDGHDDGSNDKNELGSVDEQDEAHTVMLWAMVRERLCDF